MTKSIILDVGTVRSMDDFYDEVQRALCPSFKGFGRNWSAFRDVLRGGFLVFEENESIEIVLEGIKKLKMHLPESQFRRIMKCLEEADNVTLTNPIKPRD